jgi:hypothetical protein
MSVDPETLVAEAIAGFEADLIPENLRVAVERHQQHLLSLAAALIKGGQPESFVRQAIDAVFRSYREELASTIMSIRMAENDHAA